MSKLRIALLGNPNSGKTTLFNALTGHHQRVGNWPGVTVEQKSGSFRLAGMDCELVDLPGVYSAGSLDASVSKDVKVTDEFLLSGAFDLIVNVVNACHLERQLYLSSQLLELGKPMVIALNMMDVALANGINIASSALAQALSCPVIEIQAHRQLGLNALEQAIVRAEKNQVPQDLLRNYLPNSVRDELDKSAEHLNLGRYVLYRTLEQADSKTSIDDLDIVLADARYRMIHQWVAGCQTKALDDKEQFTAKLDRYFLHRIWGLPIFFTIIYALFFLAIGVGGAIQSGLDILAKTLFIECPTQLLSAVHAPNWLCDLIGGGLGQACRTLVTFLPVLGIMYGLLAFLEASGYMARVGFVLDRLMKSLGLSGQAFVPMIIGFGCNVPAILATRVMQTERDRVLTILMNPYMSCSARLAIYAVFVAVFFPQHGAWVIFSLYALGISMALLTGWLLRRRHFKSEDSPLILELPNYLLPRWRYLYQDTRLRLWYFLKRAGQVIIPLCLLLSLINTLDFGQQSLLSRIGQSLSPIFAPMGIRHDNWPAVVSLLTGVLAKEVVIATLASLYAQLGHVALTPGVGLDFGARLKEAMTVIGIKLKALVLPFSASSATDLLPSPFLADALHRYFGSSIAAYAYLLFILLYIPCISTMAVIRQETNKRWMWFSVLWSLVLAYGSAVIFYQAATWGLHQPLNFLCILGLFLGLAVLLRQLRLGADRVIGRS